MKVLAAIVSLALATLSTGHGVAAAKCSPNCIDLYQPVCGSDGNTYSNQCRFNYQKCTTNDPTLTVVSQRECGSSRLLREGCTKPCTKIYDPVCGSDGTTYGNECELNNAKCTNPLLTKASNGKCCGLTICTAEYTPVCGSDGTTYSNKCWFKAAQCENPSLTVASDGECAGYST